MVEEQIGICTKNMTQKICWDLEIQAGHPIPTRRNINWKEYVNFAIPGKKK